MMCIEKSCAHKECLTLDIDERVTVDAISAPEHLFAPDPAGNDDEALLPIEWSTFCRVLGISDEVIPPDEFQSYRNADREVMWRAWWD